MPLKIKEAPAIVADVSPADGAKARLPAVRAAKTTEASALNDDVPQWRDTCAICFDLLPFGVDATFYECCCKSICTVCHVKCQQYDERCPLCRSLPYESDADWVGRLQKHADKGNAQAQVQLGHEYRDGSTGLQQNFKRAFQLFELAAAQGNAKAQDSLGTCYVQGEGVEIDFKTAALWYRRAAEQGYPAAQANLALMFDNGKGVAQSIDEAVKWYRLAAAQGQPKALYNLGACYQNGDGVPQDLDEALRLYERAAAKGHAGAAAAVDEVEAFLAAAARAK